MSLKSWVNRFLFLVVAASLVQGIKVSEASANSGATNSGAKSETKKQHQHAAHSHGSGKLDIAFEGSQGRIEFKVPSESIFGFEHEAKTKAQKALVEKSLAELEKNFSVMIVFASDLNCQFTKEKVEVVKESDRSSHSDTVAAFSVKCQKSPVKTQLIFNFQKYFPKIKDIDVDVVADSVQVSMEAKKSGSILKLE